MIREKQLLLERLRAIHVAIRDQVVLNGLDGFCESSYLPASCPSSACCIAAVSVHW